MRKSFRAVKPGPDRLAEELATLLAERTWFEFKPLFLRVHASLRERKAAHGGEEMLRLRTYEKLQNLVRGGLVEKVGKLYQGRLAELAAFTEHTAAQHCRALSEAVSHA